MVLKSATEIIETLGGIKGVSKLTGMSYAAVWNWKSFGRFPARTYDLLTRALHKAGMSAPASLWGMTETPERSTATREQMPS